MRKRNRLHAVLRALTVTFVIAGCGAGITPAVQQHSSARIEQIDDNLNKLAGCREGKTAKCDELDKSLRSQRATATTLTQ